MIVFIFMDKYKEFYKTIGSLKCPALDNEVIHFNNHGLRHLLIKKRKWRKPKDQLRRLRLLKYAKLIISSKKVSLNSRLIESESKPIIFWSLEMQVKVNLIVVVIVRQIGDGGKHFFSIFPRND